jgi:hypothetical protein
LALLSALLGMNNNNNTTTTYNNNNSTYNNNNSVTTTGSSGIQRVPQQLLQPLPGVGIVRGGGGIRMNNSVIIPPPSSARLRGTAVGVDGTGLGGGYRSPCKQYGGH